MIDPIDCVPATDPAKNSGADISRERSKARKRVVYLQFTNPAGYPPLEHSTRILADEGFDVLVLGARAGGTDTLRLPDHPRIKVRQWQPQAAGTLQKLNYLAFVVWAVTKTLGHRTKLIYASDSLACLPALLLRRLRRCHVVYHEHDWPSETDAGGAAKRWLARVRQKLAREADLCVLPQEERAKEFENTTGRSGPMLTVWNCPRRQEVMLPAPKPRNLPIAFYYHGSITPERLPLNLLDAMARIDGESTLTIAGYETAGSRGYMDTFLRKAASHGLTDRVRALGTIQTRAALLEAARRADVGLALMPAETSDINMRHMTGASNKPFDYMACGLFLIVSDLPGWRSMFVDPGHALACDPRSTDSLARALRWCCDHADEVRAKSGDAQHRILTEWNYERQFAPVLAYMSSAVADKPEARSA